MNQNKLTQTTLDHFVFKKPKKTRRIRKQKKMVQTTLDNFLLLRSRRVDQVKRPAKLIQSTLDGFVLKKERRPASFNNLATSTNCSVKKSLPNQSN